MRVSAHAVFVAGAMALGIAVLGARQNPQPPPQQTPPVFRGGIEVVQLDVSVLDKKRKPVRGLKAEDFTVLEDGASQRIVAVSEVMMDGAAMTMPVWARAAPPDVASNEVGDKRIFAIVIDGGGPSAPQVVEGVLDRLVPGDVVAVIGGGCYVPFTEDLEKLHNCLDSMKRAGPRTRTPMPPASRANLETPHSVLRDVAEYLAAVPQRRKAILYIGSGFMLGGGMGGRSSRGPDPQQDYRETLWFAHLANVNIYTFSSGINVRTTVNNVRNSSAFDALRSLAAQTGGMMTPSNQIDDGLDQMFVENGSYYLVGYQTSHPQMDGKFRRLSVKVNQKDVTIRTRDGWYRQKPARDDGTAAAAVPSQNLTGRLRDWMPSLDVAFDAAIIPFAQPGNAQAAIAIVTGLAEPVAPGVTRIVQKMDLRVLAYDERGSLVVDTTRRVDLDAAPSVEGRVRYNVLQQLALPPGRYSFRIVAHNAGTDKLGAIEFDVTVPDFVREFISMSGVALNAASADPVQSVGELGSIVPVLPTPVRKFSTGDRVTAFVRVYEGGDGPSTAATLDVKVLDGTGVPVYSASEPFAAERFGPARAVDYRFELPLTDLKSGAYLLSLQATRGTRRTAPRDVRFIVR